MCIRDTPGWQWLVPIDLEMPETTRLSSRLWWPSSPNGSKIFAIYGYIERFAIFAVHNCSTASQKIPSVFAVVKSPRIFDLIWLSIRPVRNRYWFEARCRISSSLSWNGSMTWSRVRAFLYVSTPVNRSSMYRFHCDGGCRYREVSPFVFRKLQQTFCGEIRRWRQPDCV